MPAGNTTSDVRVPPPTLPPEGGDFGGGGGGWDHRGASRRAFFAGLIVLLAITSIVFVSLAGAYFARRKAEDWLPVPLPTILWVNSLVILASSIAVEIARHELKRGRRSAFNTWWSAGTALGVLFLFGQALAWRELHGAGIFTASNSSASFFFLLTATHAAHLLGAVAAMTYVDVHALRFELGPARRTGAEITAIFWHFLAGLWISLLAMFTWMG